MLIDNRITLKTIDAEEAGMRLDRWFKLQYPGISFVALQKLLRSGQIRLDGKRIKAETRLGAGQMVRVPPMNQDRPGNQDRPNVKMLTKRLISHQGDRDILAQMLLYEDEKVFVFNKPSGLAVQGGSGIERHIDAMLGVWCNKRGEKPRLVHRIDKDTSGILVVARTKSAARALTESFRARETKKKYWALVRGVPRKKESKVSGWLIKETATLEAHSTDKKDRMRVAEHGEQGADHAISYYRVIQNIGQQFSWLEMEPYTGRTHQLRVHAAHIGHPILGDDRYFYADQNWVFPRGLQNRLHLHARHILIPHPSGGVIDVTAPLPAHMVQSFHLLGLEED